MDEQTRTTIETLRAEAGVQEAETQALAALVLALMLRLVRNGAMSRADARTVFSDAEALAGSLIDGEAAAEKQRVIIRAALTALDGQFQHQVPLGDHDG